MSWRVRVALVAGRVAERRTRGPADGLLEQIQRDVLIRHPEWAARLRAVEDAPVSLNAGNWASSATKYYRRKPRQSRRRA